MRKLSAKDWFLLTGKGQKAKGKRQRAKVKRQKAKGESQKAKGEGRKAKGKGGGKLYARWLGVLCRRQRG
jgi:hypothetical protein